MKCEKCGKEYISNYYFATENICKECFDKMTPEEQKSLFYKSNTEQLNIQLRSGFFIRLIAYLIDSIFQLSILFLIVYSFGILEEFPGDFNAIILDQSLLEGLITKVSPYMFVIWFIYYSSEIIFAASPGKMIFNLQIANHDRTKASFNTLSIRFFSKHLNQIISLISFVTAIQVLETVASIIGTIILIGCFFVLTVKKQSFHDMIAKTAVYKSYDIESKSIENY